MSGSRTAWFPDRLTTQAGVSGVASRSAITASTPILLPWKMHTHSQIIRCVCVQEQKEKLAMTSSYQDSVKGGRRASSLYMSKNSGASVKAEPVRHQLE